MSLDRKLPAWVLDLLDLQPSDTLLEIGPGPGVGVELAATRAPRGRVVGVDRSETMLAMALHLPRSSPVSAPRSSRSPHGSRPGCAYPNGVVFHRTWRSARRGTPDA
jgi:SAM-dependent methyltransferase